MRRLLLLLALSLCLPAQAGAGTLFLIDGRGWGHGIGMSQYGARGYAQHGWGYERILAHYYPGTLLRPMHPRPVRVLLAEGRVAVRLGSARPFRVVDARGKVRKLKPGARKLEARGLAKLRFPLRFEPGASPVTVDGKAFRGSLIVHRDARKLMVVNKLPLDRYLRGVVPWEMPDDWHPEALRAQSVVARSYALATLKPGTRFDLYSDTRSQVYGGVEAEAASTNRAIGSTAGQVLLWHGRVATSFYHSTSGGRTASVAEVWPRAAPVPYLVSVPDPYDDISKHHRWGPIRLTPEQIGKKLGLGPVRDVLGTRGPSGRVTGVKLKLRTGGRTMLSQDFRRALDLRSTWFVVRVLELEAPPARGLASKRHRTVLTGFVRGLVKVRLQQQVNGGTWKTVQRIRTRPNGRFKVSVSPRRTTSYRLAAPVGAGAVVTVKTR
ncbi:MAG TPA: SpoIID/LytB domain-containing protein [Gaiellaceae bacterium]|nr:SpoIID/LytB domain-containing protein [Gaiellaceae bacterium]